MLPLPAVYIPQIFGDEFIVRSKDWLDNFFGKPEHANRDNDSYEIILHLKDFAPEEISVKTTDDFVIVEGKHEEKKDKYGYLKRHFVRKYRLPEGCMMESVQSRLSSDGFLIISAPRMVIDKQDKVIPVSHESTKCKL